jgi:hypothetical protein
LKEAYGFGLLTFIGVLLILMGLILVILPFIMKLGIKPESIHPLLLVWRRVDGFYVGTSPILLIILVLVYLFLVLIRRPL